MMISLAGLIAQCIYNPRSVRRYHAHSKHGAAADIALYLTASDDEAGAVLKWLEVRTRGLLQLRWPLVESLAKELLARDRMKGKEVERLLNAKIGS